MSYLNKILLAHPNLKYPLFKHSVIFIYEESHRGHCGVILNKPILDLCFNDVCESKGIIAYNNRDIKVRQGGPSAETAILTLHTEDWNSDNTHYVGHGLCISSDNQMINKIADGNEPYNWRIFTGICTWAPNQLEKEINGEEPYRPEQGWQVLEYDPELIFSWDEYEQWERGVEIASSQMLQQYF